MYVLAFFYEAQSYIYIAIPDSQQRRSPATIHDRFPVSRDAPPVGGGVERPLEEEVGIGALLGRDTDAGAVVIETDEVVPLGKETG